MLFRSDTLEQNRKLFERHGFEIAQAAYFEQAYQWWLDNADRLNREHDSWIQQTRADGGRSVSMGMVIGRKPS